MSFDGTPTIGSSLPNEFLQRQIALTSMEIGCLSNLANLLVQHDALAHEMIKAMEAANETAIRDQILDNATILFPIHLPSKLVTTKANPSPHVPPLQIVMIPGDRGLRAMVFYGALDSPHKGHFLFGGSAPDRIGAMQMLLEQSTRMVADEAGKNLHPSIELEVVMGPDGEGGYVRQAPMQESHETRSLWWGSDEKTNPLFYKHIQDIEHEIDSMGPDYFSGAEDE